jgi:hypothetical protein
MHWDSRSTPGGTQNTENGISFDCVYSDAGKVGAGFSHIVGVTDDETWVSFMSVETKQHSERWMHTHSPNKTKAFKRIYAGKLMAALHGT